MEVRASSAPSPQAVPRTSHGGQRPGVGYAQAKERKAAGTMLALANVNRPQVCGSPPPARPPMPRTQPARPRVKSANERLTGLSRPPLSTRSASPASAAPSSQNAKDGT